MRREGRLVPTEAELAHHEGRSYETGQKLVQRLLEARRSNWKGKGKHVGPSSAVAHVRGELPDGWAWATVEHLNPADRPCAYGVLQPGDDVPGDVPFVRVGDIEDGRIDLKGLKAISNSIAAAYRVQSSPVLKCSSRLSEPLVALAGANVARAVGVLPILAPVNPYWVEIWFRNPAKIAELTSKAREVARKTLNLEDVRSASVALPPLTEQHRIVADIDRRMTIVREVEAEVDANVKRSDRLRESVLLAAFRPSWPATPPPLQARGAVELQT